MHDVDDAREDLVGWEALSGPRSAAQMVLGIVMLLLGGAVITGSFILFFAVKAHNLEPFPRTARYVLLFGGGIAIGLFVVGILLVGWRAAFRIGVGILLSGAGMLVFGFVKMPDPSLRFFAPLGFFVALAGGALMWASRDFQKELASAMAAAEKRPEEDVPPTSG